MDAAIDAALNMSEAECGRRLAKMRERVHEWDVEHWARHVRARFEALSSPQAEDARNAA
jgi:trehalose-6-phosphate synthase